MTLLPLLSTAGRMRPLPFLLSALPTYFAGFAALALLSTPVMDRAGVWPYVVVQVLLNWVWLALHAKRLQDSGRGWGSAVWILVPNILFQVAIAGFAYGVTALQVTAAEEQARGEQGPASTWIGLGLIYLIFGMLFGQPPLAEVWHIGKILSAIVVAIIAGTLLYTLRLAFRPTI